MSSGLLVGIFITVGLLLALVYVDIKKGRKAKRLEDDDRVRQGDLDNIRRFIYLQDKATRGERLAKSEISWLSEHQADKELEEVKARYKG